MALSRWGKTILNIKFNTNFKTSTNTDLAYNPTCLKPLLSAVFQFISLHLPPN